MAKRQLRQRMTLQHWELIIVAVTLLTSSVFSFLTLRQTTDHFRIERTSGFVSRFNSPDMVSLRESVDRWLEAKETAEHLYARSKEPIVATDPAASGAQPDNPAKVLVAQLRTMANYFQEFGTAIKIGSLDESYAHELLGAVCIRYGNELEPFIRETRIQRSRPQAYEEVFLLRDRMKILDAQHDIK